MNTSASPKELQESYVRARNMLAGDFLALQEWLSVLRGAFHNHQAAVLWAYAASGHWKTEWDTQMGAVPPLFVAAAEPAQRDLMLIMEAAVCSSMKFDDIGSLPKHQGTVWVNGTKDTNRKQRSFVVATQHEGSTKAGTNCILARAPGYRDLAAASERASRSFAQVLVHAPELWFHMRQVRWPMTEACNAAGWHNPAHIAVPLTLIHLLETSSEEDPVGPLVDAITPVQNIEVVLADRAMDFLRIHARSKPSSKHGKLFAAELAKWMFPKLDAMERRRAEVAIARGLEGRHGVIKVDPKTRLIEYASAVL